MATIPPEDQLSVQGQFNLLSCPTFAKLFAIYVHINCINCIHTSSFQFAKGLSILHNRNRNCSFAFESAVRDTFNNLRELVIYSTDTRRGFNYLRKDMDLLCTPVCTVWIYGDCWHSCPTGCLDLERAEK